MFALKLFGGLALGSDGAPLGPGAQQRRRLGLLALLALAGERGMSRDRVQAYLWPESTSGNARHALDQLLYTTRRELGPDSILTTGNALHLNPRVVGPDLWLFDSAIRSGAWRHAVDLYAGPLLDGIHPASDVEFEQLVDGERMRREHDYHSALEWLARSAMTGGDAAEAVRWWRQRAASEPSSAPVAVELMRALAAAGDRHAAIQHARIYQRMVRETLEIEPDPSVEALAQSLVAALLSVTPSTSLPVAAIPLVPAVAVQHPSSSPAAAPPMPRRASRPTSRRRRVWLAAGFVLVAAFVPFMRANPFGRDRAKAFANASELPNARDPNRSIMGARQTTDPRAQSSYLRARAAWNTRTKQGLDQSVVLYRLAIDRDPMYAAAYTGLAESYAMLGYFSFAPADAMFPKARAAALRALELDPNAGEAYAALGQVLASEHRWADAEAAYRRGIELAPNSATLHQWYGLLLSYVGRAREAATQAGLASHLDPLSVQINNMYGMMLYYAGDLSGALRQYERTVVDEPDSAWVRQNPWVLANFARVAAAAGRYDQAIRLVDRALVVVPTSPRARFDLASAYVLKGDTAAAEAAFAQADSTDPQYATDRAFLYAARGDIGNAYRWIARVHDWPLPALVTLTNEPMLARFRADPRYKDLLRTVAIR